MTIKYKIQMTNKFKKDYKKVKSKNNFSEEEFVNVITMLANDYVLPDKYCNHILEPKSKRHMGMSYKT